jgi:hypothetical protein
MTGATRQTNPPQPGSPAFQQEFLIRSVWKNAVFASLNAMTRVLAARLIVLIGVCGGIFLTYLALDHPDWFRIGALGVYCLGVVFPAVYLAVSGRA